MVVEEVTTDWCGEVVAVDRDIDTLTLEDRRGKRRTFPLGPGFLLEGRPVSSAVPSGRVHPRPPRVRRPARSRCPTRGPASRAPAGSSSRVGTTPSSSRRSGVTTCGSRASSSSTSAASTTSPSHLRDFKPGPAAPRRRPGRPPGRRARRRRGSRQGIARSPIGKHVLVVGHPFIDIWQAVKPDRLGIPAWPAVPRGDRLEDRHLPAARLAAPRPGRHRPRLEAHPRPGELLRRPRARPPRPGRGADRLHHRALSGRGASVDAGLARPRRRGAGRAG